VTGDHDDARQFAQPGLQESRPRVVEVVGRLVEHQRRRPPDEQRRKGQPGTLPAGQRTEGPVVPDTAETQSEEDALRAPVGIPGFPALSQFQPVGVLGEVPLVVEQTAEPVEFGKVFARLGQGVVEHGGNRKPRVVGHLLVQVTEVVRAFDAAAVGQVDPGQQPQ
jgi:hypothetical protein